MSTLDDVLSEKPIEKTAPEKTDAPAAEPLAEPTPPAAADGQPTRHNLRREMQKKEWAAQGRDPETGQFLPKEPKAGESPKEPEKKAEAPKEPAKPAEPAKAPAAPAQEMTEKERAAFAAAADERRKRQELERRIAEMEKAGKPAEPAKTFWDDPDGKLKEAQQAVAHERINMKLQTAEMIGRSRYTDFDEKLAVFKELATANPSLVQPWISAPDPAAFAYNLAKNHQELQQIGGIDAMRKKIEEETAARVRKEVEAEHQAKLAELEKMRASLPPSLSDVRGASSGRPSAWGGPTPLGSILKP